MEPRGLSSRLTMVLYPLTRMSPDHALGRSVSHPISSVILVLWKMEHVGVPNESDLASHTLTACVEPNSIIYSARSSACLAPDLNSSGTVTRVSRYWRNFSAVRFPMGSTPCGLRHRHLCGRDLPGHAPRGYQEERSLARRVYLDGGRIVTRPHRQVANQGEGLGEHKFRAAAQVPTLVEHDLRFLPPPYGPVLHLLHQRHGAGVVLVRKSHEGTSALASP